jgi:hypothetical protein
VVAREVQPRESKMLATIECGYKSIKSGVLFDTTAINLDRFSTGDYVISLTAGCEIIKEIPAGRKKDAALMMFKLCGAIAVVKHVQAKPVAPAAPVATATITADTKRVGFPKTEKVGNRSVPVMDKNGKPEWCVTKKMRGIIEAVEGDFKAVFSANRIAFAHDDDYGDRQTGSTIRWRETTYHFVTPTIDKVIDGELFEVKQEPKWVRMVSRPLGTKVLLTELLRMTCGTEDQVLALVNEATLGV